MDLRRKLHYRYKNLTVVFLGVVLAFFLSQNESLHAFLLRLGEFGFIGAFIAGILSVSTFTISIGALMLLILAENLSLLEIGLIAGLGGVVGDLLIFNLIKDNLAGEIEDIYDRIDSGHHVKKIFHSKYFSWTLPVIGAIIIASPLPDEMGISLINLAKISTPKFILLSFTMNTLGIFLILSASFFIKP